jgi:hypothetical protein
VARGRQVTIGEVAQVAYTARSIQIELDARLLPATMPLTYRVAMHNAHIAYRAARAELTDPKPEPVTCGVCGLALICDIDAHLRVTA